ncbi:carcinine hydrolase/isopenicillin-N N-acyltransferase family protein [Bremerella cremea]|uniref:carcinine hydrolase/isopenicillin-N N-acyltransferase family protein n=1 Tax=Bremerella cremea TaxID=1031537 RepID=UPI0031E6DE43
MKPQFLRKAYPSMWLLFAVALLAADAKACTTAVISGKVTADGRPLLWKNRDTSTGLHNEVAVITGGKYKAVAVVNAGQRSTVWMGVNEAGFCIENSLSRDLAIKEDTSGPGNGSLMRMALQTCATVDDFRRLLEETNVSGRSTIANFGVIDAHGGAVLFETGPKTYKLFDANDPVVAPDGYVVRSNFSTTAQQLEANPTRKELDKIYSAERYLRARDILDLCASDKIDLQEVVRQCCRDMSDDSGKAYAGTINGPAGELPESIATTSTISRTTTVSAVVFHGVKRGENPKLTTMWTMLGDPKFSIAVPVFPIGHVADPLEDEKGGEIGEIAISLRDWRLTPDRDGVFTSGLAGMWKDMWSTEDHLISVTLEAKERWAKEGIKVGDVKVLQTKAAEHAMKAMQQELIDEKNAALQLTAPAPPEFGTPLATSAAN